MRSRILPSARWAAPSQLGVHFGVDDLAELLAQKIHAHVNEVGRHADIDVGLPDPLQPLEITLIIRPLEQIQEPVAVPRLQVGRFGFILEELGGIGHLQEEVVEIPDQLPGVRFT